MLNNGVNIRVRGDVGDYLGDGMWSGEIIVEGNAGYGLASTLTGVE